MKGFQRRLKLKLFLKKTKNSFPRGLEATVLHKENKNLPILASPILPSRSRARLLPSLLPRDHEGSWCRVLCSWLLFPDIFVRNF